MSQNQINILERALNREKAARKEAEKILEKKTKEFYEANLKLENLLNKTESQLQGVFDSIVDAYVMMDLMGNILKLNEAAISLLGLNNERVNYNLIEMVDPSDLVKVQAGFKKLYNEGSITDFKVNIITKKNERKLVHVNASIIFDGDSPIGAQGIVRDITIENKYRKKIELEKEKYYRIISNMHIGLVEIDLADRILYANQSFIEMTGYSQNELIGIKGKDILVFEEDKDLIEEVVSARKKGKIGSYEIRIKNKQGELKYWLVSGAPNYNVYGDITGSIGVNYDITEFKSLQLQKEKLHEKLEKSNEELQEYAHVVSHDLKSPLRSINALVSWLKDDNKETLDESSLQNIDLIENTIEKMEHLITDVLEYASVGSDDTEMHEVDLDTLINDLLKILYIPEHINVKVLSTLPKVQGNKTKLQQVFQNLISNAIKFSNKEKGLIEINCTELETHYQFSVEDNGIGIEAKYHDRIFKVFHSINKSKDSTGVGLAIVKKIVNLHHGDVWLKSDLNQGSTFFFTLKK